jgi:hypothetical protein
MSNNDPRFAKIANDCREARVAFPEKLVERFERVAKQLNKDWGKLPAAEYLNDLIFPSRPGRRGFPPEVAEEILALKTLHEEKYTFAHQTVWDPFDTMFRDKEASRAASELRNQKDVPSVYRTRNSAIETPAAKTEYSAPAAQIEYSAMITGLLPETVRKLLVRIRSARAQSGLAVTIEAPDSELDELLVDAEYLLEAKHFNSATAILEQITTLFPEESPFPFLRLMEVYHLMGRPDDFEWVNQRLSEQFNCSRVEWITQHGEFMAALDRLAESFLVAMRR